MMTQNYFHAGTGLLSLKELSLDNTLVTDVGVASISGTVEMFLRVGGCNQAGVHNGMSSRGVLGGIWGHGSPEIQMLRECSWCI